MIKLSKTNSMQSKKKEKRNLPSSWILVGEKVGLSIKIFLFFPPFGALCDVAVAAYRGWTVPETKRAGLSSDGALRELFIGTIGAWGTISILICPVTIFLASFPTISPVPANLPLLNYRAWENFVALRRLSFINITGTAMAALIGREYSYVGT